MSRVLPHRQCLLHVAVGALELVWACGLRLLLPCEARRQCPPVARGPHGRAGSPSAPRILVAEDDDEMRHLVSEALRNDGYDVIAVSGGGCLLVTLARELIDGDGGRAIVDLLVLDARPPIRSGMQVLEELRATLWQVPVILSTAFGNEATREHAGALGAVVFDKPFALDDLRTAVSCLLRRAA